MMPMAALTVSFDLSRGPVSSVLLSSAFFPQQPKGISAPGEGRESDRPYPHSALRYAVNHIRTQSRRYPGEHQKAHFLPEASGSRHDPESILTKSRDPDAFPAKSDVILPYPGRLIVWRQHTW